MSVFDTLTGQLDVRAQLTRAAAEEKPTHAWLFTGPPGAGRSTAALAFAAALLCDQPDSAARGCGHCRSCQTVLSGSHADFLHFTTEKTTITIEEARDFVVKAQDRPAVGRWRVMLIEDADRMGLSQLYQIRGRVGRSARKAYAYFTFRRDRVLTEVAAKRLSAIREFTAFGSGVRIAMRDLQIRGAGSLLGHSQHGHMEAVGYDLYVKMLGQAIAAARGEAPEPDKSDCIVDIAADAFLPEAYIPDAAGRIEAYKRIAAIETADDAEDVLDELIDRYGDPPKSVQSLVDVSLVRVTAARVGVVEITQKGSELLLYSDVVGPQQMGPLLDAMPRRVKYCALGRPYLSLHLQPGEDPLVILRDAVALLPGARPRQG